MSWLGVGDSGTGDGGSTTESDATESDGTWIGLNRRCCCASAIVTAGALVAFVCVGFRLAPETFGPIGGVIGGTPDLDTHTGVVGVAPSGTADYKKYKAAVASDGSHVTLIGVGVADETFSDLAHLFSSRAVRGRTGPVELNLEPHKTYSVKRTIKIPPGPPLVLSGRGSSIKWVGAASPGYIFLIANGTQRLTITHLQMLCQGLIGGITSKESFADVSIMRVNFHQPAYASKAIHFLALPGYTQQRGHVISCSILQALGPGIGVFARGGTSKEHWIHQNRVNGTYGHAIVIGGPATSTVSENNISHVNNRLPTVDDGRFGHGIAVAGAGGDFPVRGIVVRQNRINIVGGWPLDAPSTYRKRYRFGGIEIADAVIGAKVYGNVVHTVRYGYGIYFGGALAPSSNAVIYDNDIVGARDVGIQIDSRHPHSLPTSDVKVYNNRISQCSPIGMYIDHAKDLQIYDNVLIASGDVSFKHENGVADAAGPLLLAQTPSAPVCVNCNLHSNTAQGTAPRNIWGSCCPR